MLTVIRDTQGQIIAACEWVPCDAYGQPSNTYTHVWVNHLEVSRGAGRQAIRDVIAQIAAEAPLAKAGYWERRSKTNCGLREWTRQQLFKEVTV